MWHGPNMTNNNLIPFSDQSPLAVLREATDTHSDYDCIVVVGVLKNGSVRIINSGTSMYQVSFIKCFLDKWILEKLRF